MPVVVPRIEQGSIGPQLAGVPHTSSNVTATGLGGNIGSALQQAGGVLADIQYREQQKTDAAQANQSRIALSTFESSQFDPNNPDSVYSYKGANALQAPDAVQQRMDDFAAKYRQNLTNGEQQQQFDQLYADHRLQVTDRVNRYALGEHDKYQQEAYQGAVGSALSAATEKATSGDLAGASLAAKDGVQAIMEYGEAHGQPKEFTDYSVDKFLKTAQAATQSANKANAEAYVLQNPQQALSDFSARLGLAQYSPSSIAASSDPNAPRGVRNNNPGNIQKTDVQWQGKVDSADPRYEAFATPEAGIRALALNAKHLQANGAQSVTDLISRWSPAAENGKAGTEAYIADVAKSMGVSPTDNIDLQDPAQLTAFTNAVINHENGSNPYTPDQVALGVKAATGGAKLPDTHPTVATNGSGLVVPGTGADSKPLGQLGQSGNPMVDALDTASTVDLYNRARAEVNRGQVNLRGSIAQREKDDAAAFKAGQNVAQPLSLGDYTRAYGDREGMQRFGAYQADQQLGHDLQTVATLTPAQMQDLATARAPAPGENFAIKQQDHVSLVNAMNQTLTERQKDPVSWAMQANVGGFQPLDTSNPDKLAGSIAARVGPAQAVSQEYQTPYRLLTKDESTRISGAVNAFAAKDKAAVLGALSSKLDPADYAQVISTIKGNSPTTAIAGQIMGAGRAALTSPGGIFHSSTSMDAATIAQTMLDGDALINPTKADKDANGAPKFAMPSDSPTSGLRSTWNTVVGDAFRGDGQGEMQAYQAYRAMYAGLAAKAGNADGVLDDTIATEAARATIGNVGTWNNKNVIPPYGMDFNVFKDAAARQWQVVRADVPGADQQDLSGYDLDRIGDGAYAVSNGQAPLRDKEGRPVVLRIAAANADQIKAAAQRQASESKKPGLLSRASAVAGKGVDAIEYGIGHIPLVSRGNDGD